VLYREHIARTRKREFRDCEYWGRPVPGFGDPKALLWVVGLAPAAHGANRTGRMFTGDRSGDWLYRALFDHGFANQGESTRRDDGLCLKGAYVGAAARCAPPDNKPTPEEQANCASYLDDEFELLGVLKRGVLILALGGIAFGAVLRLLQRRGIALPRPQPRFTHGGFHDLGGARILCSYHPSRQNTQTGRLTREMWNALFRDAVRKSSRS